MVYVARLVTKHVSKYLTYHWAPWLRTTRGYINILQFHANHCPLFILHLAFLQPPVLALTSRTITRAVFATHHRNT